MADIDFSDPKAREAYFQPKEGRPSDSYMIEDACAMAAFVGPHAMSDDPFLSNDICFSTRLYYPGQGVYIGQRVSYLERLGKLPIRRKGTLNKRAIYAIV